MRINQLALRMLLPVVALAAGCQSDNKRSQASIPEPVLLGRSRPQPPPPVSAPPAPRPEAGASVDTKGLPEGVVLTGGVRRPWKYIIIHHSASEAGSAAEFDRFHRSVRGWDELGYHFVIGNGRGAKDGLIQVGPRWPKQKHGAHCKTADNRYNDFGIGICLVGNFQGGGKPTAAQLSSLERLIRYLTRAYQIPLSSVQTHGGVTHKTECPGRNFSLAALKMRLSSLAAR